MKTVMIGLAALVVGLMVGRYVWQGDTETNVKGEHEHHQAAEKEVLYWVAPMDPNFKRDQPGLSPMGMDLVPVYADNAAVQDAANQQAGAVAISARVSSNMGVTTAMVDARPIKTSISALARVKFDQNRIVHIHPRLAGWVEQLHIKAVGDPVTKGEPLYSLYTPELVNAQQEYLLALSRKDRAIVAGATKKLKALQLTDDFIAQLKRTKQVTDRVTFYAPQSGVLEGLKIREGYYVEPGTTLMSIANIDQVWVLGEVFESDANQIKVGQMAHLNFDFLAGQHVMGQVDYVYPTLDAVSRTLQVRVKLVNVNHQLKPEMFGEMRIDVADAQPVTAVPVTALIRTGDQDRVVLAMSDGQFKSVAVKVGQIGGQYAQVLQGLNVGDSVVTSAQFLIDSESSKTSDFARMQVGQPMNHEQPKQPQHHNHH